jgi:hypothetical protein
MAVSFAGLGSKSKYTVNYRPVLSSERALQNNNTQMYEGTFKEKEKLVKGPRWAPDTKTDWPTDCRSQINFSFNELELELGMDWTRVGQVRIRLP